MDDFAGLAWPSDGKSTSSQQAKSSIANSPSGTNRPNYSPNLSSHSFSQTQSQQQSRSASSLSKTAGAKDDPFGELVSFNSSQNNQAKMTLRERQQMLDQNSRSSSPFAGTPLRQEMQQKKQEDMWNFDVLERAGSSRSGAGTPAVVQQQHQQMKGNADFSAMDFDPLSSGKQTKSNNTGTGFAPSSLSGYKGANLLDDDEPIPMDITPPPPPPASQSVEKPSKNSSVEAAPVNGQQRSPEPFVDRDFEIAQIAGYGFSTEQAKAALEISGSTRAAIQLLREQQSTAHEMNKQHQHQQRRAPHGYEPNDSSSDDDAGYSHRDNRRRPQQQQQQPMSFFGNKGGADALLSTANELGSTMWKQANSWFALGKKKIVEMQETVMDQRRSGGAGRGWRDEDYLPSQQPYRDSSSSDDDDADMYVSAYRRRQHEQQGESQAQSRQPRAMEERGRPTNSFTASSFKNGAGQRAESFIDMDGGFTETKSTPAPQKPKRQPPGASSATVSATPPPAQIPALPAHVLQGAHGAKTAANEQFKLGQFGDAIGGYTEAISHVTSTSPEHPLLIVLYNNRALAYARNGESKNAAGDCSQALALCTRYQGNGVVELGSGAGRVDVVDQRGKALQRRGEALEAEEKYEEALGDWKTLREAAREAGVRQQAVRGIQRCSKALGIGQPAASAAPAAASPAGGQKDEDLASVFASISLSNVKSGGAHALNRHTENSAAVAAMRLAESAKQAEDDQRLAMLDQVDLEIRRWRDGKQHNLRALLSSVHMLLPHVPAVGMHEVLEPSKVKRAYLRAISKLHPDKLAKDVDLRTRMVSASVFASLNEAWDAFKLQEGVN